MPDPRSSATTEESSQSAGTIPDRRLCKGRRQRARSNAGEATSGLAREETADVLDGGAHCAQALVTARGRSHFDRHHAVVSARLERPTYGSVVDSRVGADGCELRRTEVHVSEQGEARSDLRGGI